MAMLKHPEKIIFEYSRPGRGSYGQWPTEQRHVDGRRCHRQALVGADVGGRLGTSDVLLARLQCECESLHAADINGSSYDTPGHLPNVRLLASHKPAIRPTPG